MTQQLSIGDLVTHEGIRAAVIKQAKKRSKAEKESPEELFDSQCRARQLPVFVRQAMFAKQALGRRWTFDFCNAQYMLAVEVEGLVVRKLGGQTVVMGRHASIAGFKEDCIKYASAALLGWTVLRFEQSQIKSGEAIDFTMRTLAAKGWKP